MLHKEVGIRFQECRKKAELTQEQLAEKTGFSVPYISQIECGKAFPRDDRLVRILNVLGVSADAILCDVLDGAIEYLSNELSGRIGHLQKRDQREIYEVVEVLVSQKEKRKKGETDGE